MALSHRLHSQQTLPSHFKLLFLLCTLSHLALTLPATSRPNTLLLPSPLQATRPSCAENPNFPEWYQPSKKFDNGDCQKAIEIFNNDYVQTHEGTRYEFYTSKVSPIHGIPAQRVPLKFAHGTCTVAIAMRNQFNWGELPHETPFRSAPSDVSSFQKIYQGVLEINNECVEMDGQPGWYESGDLNSIAVFIWQAGSDINQRIQPSLGGQGAYNTTQLLLDTA